LVLVERVGNLRVGRHAAHQRAQQNANAEYGQTTADQDEFVLPIGLFRGCGDDFRTSFLARHGTYSITVEILR